MINIVNSLTICKGKISFYYGKNFRDIFLDKLSSEPVVCYPLNIRVIS
jgi:hypothetical protein